METMRGLWWYNKSNHEKIENWNGELDEFNLFFEAISDQIQSHVVIVIALKPN